MFLLSVAFATNVPVLGDPLSPTRQDTPRDGQLLLSGSAAREAVLTSPGVADATLTVEVLVESRATPRSVIHPPAGGWPIGAELTVGPVDQGLETPTALTFQAADTTAPPPSAVTSVTSVTGEWEPGMEYLWGCCTHVRQVTLDVVMPSVDSWSMVELSGTLQFEDPVDPRLPLDVQMATSTMQFQAIQWIEEDGSVEPSCFEVNHRSASGVRGAVERVCLEDGPPPVDGTDDELDATGCATLQQSGSWMSWIGRRR